jgi:hypothetical protein
VDRTQVFDHLSGKPQLLRTMELLGPAGQSDRRKSEKLREVAGFCAIILRYVRACLAREDPVRVLECSCGKSYLGFALGALLEEVERKGVRLQGVDVNPALVERCRSVAGALGLSDASFACCRTIEFQSEERFDLVVSLHACDTATDEAIAKGIQIGAKLILAVPCCQNQVRGQIRSGHPLTAITDFGLARYRLANLLTDVLRAQFLHSAGYRVEMDEIGSEKLTPKNLCICARKVKRKGRTPRDRQYRALRDLFGIRPEIEVLCPGVVSQEGDRAG